MSEHPFTCLSCPVVVLRALEARVMGDTVADTLRDEFHAVYGHSRAVHAVVDLEAVQYISSAGLRPLLSLIRQVRARGGRMILCNLQPDVEEVFRATPLLSSGRSAPAGFESRPDVPSAVASLYQAGCRNGGAGRPAVVAGGRARALPSAPVGRGRNPRRRGDFLVGGGRSSYSYSIP